jgi:AsmA protein
VARLDTLALQTFGGTITGTGRVDHHGEAPAFAFDTAVRGIDVAKLMAARAPDAGTRLVGRLDADWSVEGSGADDAAVRRSLTGKGHVEIHDGAIVGLNIAEGVLSGLSGMVGLASLIPPGLRDRHPDIFSTGDTRFDTLSADLRIGGQRLLIDSAVAAAKDYSVHGQGTLTFDQVVDMTATLTASLGLTKDLVGAVSQAQLLADEAGRISIPFRLAGRLPNVRPKPDTEVVSRVLRKALSAEGLEQLLGGKGKGGGKGSGRNAIQRGLDQLFGR